MLLEHHAGDLAHGLESSFLAYFEPRGPRAPRVAGLGLTGWSSVRKARARFAGAPPSPARCLAYHNCWGLPLFADLDHSDRRVGILHTDFPGLPDCLQRLRGLLDGLLCVSQPLLDLARRGLPELAGERLGWLPYPVADGERRAGQSSLLGRPLVLGFAGRLASQQKRMDRFPELVRRLRETGVAFRLEFLGDGPQERWLRRQFAGDAGVRFHGRQSGESYRAVLRQWDVVAYVSDYEGLPITLLEALACGVIPLYPRIGSGGDAYVAQVRPDLLYPAGDLGAAAAAIWDLAAMNPADLAALRRRCLEAARPHTADCYLGTFGEFTRRLTTLPRISLPAFPPRQGYASDWVPMSLLRLFWPIRLWQPNRPAAP